MNKSLGCFIGSAIGDALGAPVEFKPRDSYAPIIDYKSGGPFNLKEGDWTDDTSLSLALADSILETKTIDKQNLIEKFCSWYLKGFYSHNGFCFDIGNTTASSLNRYIDSGVYSDALLNSSTNGSIMRLSPVPIFWKDDLGKCIEMSVEQSKTTHGAYVVLECNKILAGVLWGLLNGYSYEYCLEKFGNKSLNFYKNRSRDNVRSSGYVVDTLEASLWSVANTRNFDEAVLLAVNLGGDTDTVGAVTGQIAGALYGFESIRKDWIERLTWKEKLIEVGTELHEG